MDGAPNPTITVASLELGPACKKMLEAKGFTILGDFEDTFFPDLYPIIGFGQAKELLKALLEHKIAVRFAKPDWKDDDWRTFVDKIVTEGIVTWKEVAMAVCGELNPPQVGTAIASNPSFQKNYPARETMKNVMTWFYAQPGRCAECGTRLFLEADHVRSKQDYRDSGLDPTDSDRLENLQLLCKRCNVIKRPSHLLGGISFAPAQSVLMWILLAERPASREEFYKLCRAHGLTMASIRFDEAWAFAEWLKREGKYP